MFNLHLFVYFSCAEKQCKIAMILLCPVQGPWASSYDNAIPFYIQFGLKKANLICIHLGFVDIKILLSFNDCSLENFSNVPSRIFTYVRIMYVLNRNLSSKQEVVGSSLAVGKYFFHFVFLAFIASPTARISQYR